MGCIHKTSFFNTTMGPKSNSVQLHYPGKACQVQTLQLIGPFASAKKIKHCKTLKVRKGFSIQQVDSFTVFDSRMALNWCHNAQPNKILHRDTKHYKTGIMSSEIMLSVTFYLLLHYYYAECQYGKCHYAKCYYTECRGAIKLLQFVQMANDNQN